MKKRKSARYKNYFKLFADYARAHEIWFSVLACGRVDYATMKREGVDLHCKVGHKFGSKAAYEWLLAAHIEANDTQKKIIIL